MKQEYAMESGARAYRGAIVEDNCKTVLYREWGEDSGESDLAIKLAIDENDRREAAAIVNRMYDQRGYGSSHQLAERPNWVTFSAHRGGSMIGTLSLNVDSSQRLGADDAFADELARFRALSGVRLCELTKFAFDPSPESRPLLAKLFHVIFMYGTQRYNCTDLLIEVNPRHVRFYEIMLGFARVGELRTNESVGAPSQLMHLSIAEIRRNIELFAGISDYQGRSLYPYFLQHEDEARLRAHLAELSGVSQSPALGSASSMRPQGNAVRSTEYDRVAA